MASMKMFESAANRASEDHYLFSGADAGENDEDLFTFVLTSSRQLFRFP